MQGTGDARHAHNPQKDSLHHVTKHAFILNLTPATSTECAMGACKHPHTVTHLHQLRPPPLHSLSQLLQLLPRPPPSPAPGGVRRVCVCGGRTGIVRLQWRCHSAHNSHHNLLTHPASLSTSKRARFTHMLATCQPFLTRSMIHLHLTQLTTYLAGSSCCLLLQCSFQTCSHKSIQAAQAQALGFTRVTCKQVTDPDGQQPASN